MSFISTLTWSCIELQNLVENPNVKEEEKKDMILKHLNSMDEDNSRDVFPEFESGVSSFIIQILNVQFLILIICIGLEWFNVKQSLSLSSDFKDQIVVVDFFTYCCINCMHILPDLHALEDKYPSDQTGVVVVSIYNISS
jgi:thiol-disulfide isomerase/thioredoxin